MNDFMIDLETMSLASNASIVAIGAVNFDLQVGIANHDATFYQAVDLASCVDAGLDLDPKTVMWWMEQNDEARGALFGNAIPLRAALDRLTAWIESFPTPWGERRIWGNGAAYDNVVLKNAYQAAGRKQPWKYKHDMCYRTMRVLATWHEDIMWPEDLVAHNALDDAMYQTLNLLDIVKGPDDAVRV